AVGGRGDAGRRARLDQPGLVLLQGPRGPGDLLEVSPVAAPAAVPAVDDEVVAALGDLRVEVVHHHPERGLLGPAEAGELGSAGGADRAGARQAHSSSPTTAAAAAISRPLITSPSAPASSGASQRSGPGPSTS